MKYRHTLNALQSMPWMIQPEKLEAFFELVLLRIEGGGLTPEEILERTDHPRKSEAMETKYHTSVGQSQNRQRNAPNQIAVLPIVGVIMHRPVIEGLSSGGGFNLQDFQKRFRAALENPNVSAIVLDVDSPGGAVHGIDEMSQEIYRARNKKKIVAVANTLAASAAYYIASAAEELVVTPSGEVGSIGVYILHQDMSEAYKQKGVKTTLIKAGRHKAEGNPWNPLDDESKASIQKKVNDHYDMFTRAVARNRTTPLDIVRNGFGEGRTVLATEAVKLGMADRVGTLQSVLDEFTRGRYKNNSAFTTSALTAAEQRQREIDMS